MNTRKSTRRATPIALLCLVSLVVFSWPDTSLGQSLAGDEPVRLSPRGLRVPHSDDLEGVAWTRTCLALGLTLGIVVLGAVLARKFIPGVATRAGGPVRILCQTPLGTRGIVYVLRCGPRVLVVGATAGHLTTLAEISDPDEMDQFTEWDVGTLAATGRRRSEPMSRSPNGELRGQLHGMLDKIESWKMHT